MKNAAHAQSAPNLPAAKPGKTATGTAASAAAITADPRWAALCTRDPAAEGRFVYAVRSTGIYCRPTCPSRRPKPENVQFFADGTAAAAAGFRPCRRCRPEEAPLAQRQAAVVADLCRFIEAAETPPTLAQLAARAGLSPHHLHRLFQAHTGLTPGAYAKARRAERLRQNLAAGQGVTEAAYGAGYNASSRLYSEAGRVLGMTPGRFRQGGAAEEIRFAVAQTSLGALLAARSARGLCAILLGDDPLALVADLQARFPKARLIGSGPEEEGQTAGAAGSADFAAWVAQVVGLVEAPRLGLALPLDLQGTAFQRRVWQALQAIPPGETRSYTEIARDLGLPKAVRAVAAACAANPLAVAVPCHRVVRSDGNLAGYRWGLERKAALQQRERQQAENPAASTAPPHTKTVP